MTRRVAEIHSYFLSVALRLGHAEPVPERIFKDRFHTIELIFRFGYELHAFRLQFLKGLTAISGLEGTGTEHALFSTVRQPFQHLSGVFFRAPALHLVEVTAAA